MSATPIHSTGRGGAGNIGPDPNVYSDAGIIREGLQGEGEGDFSTGRGGAGNIAQSPQVRPQNDSPRRSQDYIPEQSLRQGQENFHTGRGGGGNVHKEKYGGHSHSPERKGLGDKVKHALGMDKKDKHEPAEPSPLARERSE